jgi:hypothetical protein
MNFGCGAFNDPNVCKCGPFAVYFEKSIPGGTAMCRMVEGVASLIKTQITF